MVKRQSGCIIVHVILLEYLYSETSVYVLATRRCPWISTSKFSVRVDVKIVENPSEIDHWVEMLNFFFQACIQSCIDQWRLQWRRSITNFRKFSIVNSSIRVSGVKHDSLWASLLEIETHWQSVVHSMCGYDNFMGICVIALGWIRGSDRFDLFFGNWRNDCCEEAPLGTARKFIRRNEIFFFFEIWI